MANTNAMSRKDFLKKTAVGAVSLALLGKFGFNTAEAAYVTDNLDGSGAHTGPEAPPNKKMLWIDTANAGVMKYFDGTTWTPIRSTWDE